MKGLSYGLNAKNSESDLRMFVDKDENGEIHLAICGQHSGKHLQIDFDSLDRDEALQLADFIRERAAVLRQPSNAEAHRAASEAGRPVQRPVGRQQDGENE